MRKEEYMDITEMTRQRGGKIRSGARLIIATGGDYRDNRRFWGYYAGWNTLKLYPADGYTASVTPRPFCMNMQFIDTSKPVKASAVDPAEAERRAAEKAAKERREMRRAAEARAREEQFDMFEGGTANAGA